MSDDTRHFVATYRDDDTAVVLDADALGRFCRSAHYAGEEPWSALYTPLGGVLVPVTVMGTHTDEVGEDTDYRYVTATVHGPDGATLAHFSYTLDLRA